MLMKRVAAMLLLYSVNAQADVNCPGIYERGVSDDTYFVLTFVGGGTAASAEARQRQSKRGQLESNVTPRLQDFVYKIAKPIASSAPSIVLLTCDFAMGASDLDREDLQGLAKRNVLATVWGGSEDGKASAVYVSLPHYLRRSGPRREVEVVWLRVSAGTDDLEDWGKEFARNSIAHQAMLALAVGFAAIKREDWQLAKLSLCQARSDLKLITKETVRPEPSDLQQDMGRLVKEALEQVDEEASRKGVNLNAVPPIKLACST